MVEVGDRRGAYRRRPGPKPNVVPHFEWCKHNDKLVRVWRSDWFSDQFEIMNHDDFKSFTLWATRFSFSVRLADCE